MATGGWGGSAGRLGEICHNKNSLRICLTDISLIPQVLGELHLKLQRLDLMTTTRKLNLHTMRLDLSLHIMDPLDVHPRPGPNTKSPNLPLLRSEDPPVGNSTRSVSFVSHKDQLEKFSDLNAFLHT